jgi:hypothetical protein
MRLNSTSTSHSESGESGLKKGERMRNRLLAGTPLLALFALDTRIYMVTGKQG